MKKYILAFSVFILFWSCKSDLDGYEYQVSPTINLVAGIFPDSVLKIVSFDSFSLLDTIQLGDTVRIVMILEGFGNNLTDLSLGKSEYANIDIPDIESIFTILDTQSSDIDQFKFKFKSGYYALSLPINYIPTQVSNTDSLSVTLSTDITTKDNTVQKVLRIPVIRK